MEPCVNKRAPTAADGDAGRETRSASVAGNAPGLLHLLLSMTAGLTVFLTKALLVSTHQVWSAL